MPLVTQASAAFKNPLLEDSKLSEYSIKAFSLEGLTPARYILLMARLYLILVSGPRFGLRSMAERSRMGVEAGTMEVVM